MSNPDRFPIRNTQTEFQLQPQHQQQQQPIKRHHTARYYANRVRESLTARVTKFVCAIFLSLLLVAGIVCFILWLSLRPHRPRFHLIEFSVPGLASGFDQDSQITFKLTARNSNQHIGIYYNTMVGSVLYRDKQIGSAPLLRPLYQEPKTTSIVYGTFDAAFNLTVNSNRWKELTGDREKGKVVFRLDIASAIRFKVTTWDTKKHKLHISCDVAVGPDGSLLPTWINKRCPVYFS